MSALIVVDHEQGELIPDVCPNGYCQSKQLTWELTTETTGVAGQGRLNSHDVKPVLMLGCDECSETVALVKNDAVVHDLVRRPAAIVKIEVVATRAQATRWRGIEDAARAVLRRVKPHQLGSLGQEALECLRRNVEAEVSG